MRISILQSIVLSLGYIAVLSALTISSVKPRDVAPRIEMIHENMILGHLEGRAPRARGGGKPARPNGSRPQKKKKPTKKKSPVKKKSSVKKKTSTRKKTSARKKSPIKKKTTTRKKSPTQKKTTTRRKKNAKSRPSRKTPTSKKPTQTRPARPPITKRPTSAKHTSSSRIKSRPFTLAPQPTKAVNSCLISGIDCFVNLKARREVDTKFNARYEESHSLEKRGRDFAAIALKSGDLQVYDKGNHESGPLENGKAGKKWEEAWVDFQNNDIKDVDVKLYPKRPTQLQINGEPRLYRAEHIVELQSISRFIEALTQTPSKANPVPLKLTAVIDDAWFTEWWNKNVQDKVDSRLSPAPGYENSRDSRYKDTSLNDIIFEAMGSTRNAEDFVLCEDGINAAKAKLWIEMDPSANWEEKALDAAQGLTTIDQYLTPFRIVFGVYNYMDLPRIKKSLHSTIAKVETEFKNVAHLTDDNLPKDTTGGDADLSALWIEFMNKQLARFANKGKEWLREQVKHGKDAFEDELKIMQTWQRKIPTMDVNTRTTKFNAAVDAHATKMKAVQQSQQKATRALADIALEEKSLNAKHSQDPVALKKELKSKTNKLGKLKKVLNTLNTQVKNRKKDAGRAQRSILEYDLSSLQKRMKQIQDNIVQLEKFDMERKKIKTPSAV